MIKYNFKEDACRISDEIIENRRYLHRHPELGFHLPNTISYVRAQLESYGYDVTELGGGLTCTAGTGTPCIMLRADMDALPQQEVSGVPFASENDGVCHACGHDGHTAMLLGAAKILKSHEEELEGTVKFMFQPAEELLQGSQSMIDAGILENPKVDVAMGMHMNFGPCGNYDMSVGTIATRVGQMMQSADEFEIVIKGKASHGSQPENGVNALSVAANIITSIQQIKTLDVPAGESCVVLLAKISGGKAANIIPDEVIIGGSMRTYSGELREKLKEHISDIVTSTARIWGAEAEVNYIFGTGPVENDPELAEEMLGYVAEVAEKIVDTGLIKGSEDFANIGKHVPTFFANVCAGGVAQGYAHMMHDPALRFDEEGLKYGAAVEATCAANWLSNHTENK